MSDVEMNQNVARAMREIEQCPPWTKIGAKDVSKRRELMKRLDRLAGEETSVLRTAVSRLVAKWRETDDYSLDNMSKLFVMHRYIFKVPGKSRRDKARFFGGWVGVPYDEKEAP